MLANPQLSSTSFDRTSQIGSARQPKRPIGSHEGSTLPQKTDKQPLWIPMLQSASKGKDLSEKQLIILGGTPDLQREFLEHLNPESSSGQNVRSNDRRKQRQTAPVSNKFALGYTYYDVLDADHDDVLARMNVYMLANPSGQFGALLKPLLNRRTVKDTLVTILLDWTNPFRWARELRQWIRLLRRVILESDDETKLAMEENMNAWKEKRTGPDAQSSVQQEIIAQLGPGELDEGLGLPISIVCVQSEKIERLEREFGWGDDQFDFLQQWLRTVLLKHGGSLVYTASFEPNSVRTLLHTSLNIQSLLKRETVTHNVIDRDKILVPPNWDSWGKIRILREGFDPETISNAWSVEIQDPPENRSETPKPQRQNESTSTTVPDDLSSTSTQPTSAVSTYEHDLPNPTEDTQTLPTSSNTEITVIATSFQEFLQTQATILEKLRAEDAAGHERVQKRMQASITSIGSGESSTVASRSMSPVKTTVSTSSMLIDSIGAHRVNVNGIDLDAEEATRRLRERENERNALRRGVSEMGPVVPSGSASPVKPSIGRGLTSDGSLTPSVGASDGKPSNEALHGFFANLIKKGEQRKGSAVGSGNASPRRESPAPDRRREE